MSNSNLKGGAFNKAPFFLITILVLSLMASSCTTSSSVLSFIIPDGKQQYYIPKTNLKQEKINVDVDFTIHVADSKICDSVVVNYTLNHKANAFGNLNLAIEYDGASFSLKDAEMLYKDLNTKSVRYTSSVDSDIFRNIIYSSSIIIVATKEDGTKVNLYSPKLEKTIQQLRDVIE